MLKKEIIAIKSKDGISLALSKIYSTEANPTKHLFLTHGTFSDKSICLGLGKFFIEKGFTAWILEWRNHGDSAPAKNFNFETVALYDIAAVFKYLFEEERISNIQCITHSGGGICLSMFLMRNPIYQEKVNSIIFFSCQAFGAGFSSKNHLKILLSKYISVLIGFVPGKKLGLGPHNEDYYTMKQWFNWNLNANFIGDDGYDYKANMNSIAIPILSICAAGDKFIAPVYGCEAFLEAFENPKNKLLYCSTASGYLENYDHARIMLSRNSAKEIWLLAYDWVVENRKYNRQ